MFSEQYLDVGVKQFECLAICRALCDTPFPTNKLGCTQMTWTCLCHLWSCHHVLFPLFPTCVFVRFDLSENIIKALSEITSALRHRSDPPGQALRDTHVPDATIFAIYTFHNLRCRNLQISHSVDLAISRFHNLEISESPDCKSQIANLTIGVRWCAHKMSDVPEPWYTWITRCATWDVQWHVPHTMSWVCTTWYVPHDVSRDTCVCMFGGHAKLDGTACLHYSPYHTPIFLDRAIGHCPMCQLHTHSCVRATCACTPYLLCCNLRMLDWSPTHTTQIAKCGDLQ